MTLTNTQRLDRLKVRLEELQYWRARESVPIEGWTFEGAPIAVGAPWPVRDGVVRFEARTEVPAHWPLEASRLQLDLGGESLVTLRYGAEEERFGLDPYHKEFPLRGRDVGISAESVARFPFGEPNRDPRLHTAQLLWIEGDVEHLHLLLRQIAEACAALGTHEVVPHLLSAAEAAQRGLDWPSATQTYIARTAPSPGQQRIWQLPALEAPPSGLNQAERRSVADAIEVLTASLKALQERFPPQGEVLLTGHAHIDLAWLWPYAETRRKMRRTFHTALGLIDRSPDFRFNQSTAQYYAQMEDDDPELFGRIKAAARKGGWETIGGMWVEPDTNMPTGESLVRQILYGQLYFERTFGARHTVCWLPDCFGFSGALPQLLRQGGIESFFTIKVNWSETDKFPHDLFWWEGLDGTRVLAHTFENPLGGYNGVLQPQALLSTWANFRGKGAHPQTLLAVGYGDGGGGVTPEMVMRETQLRDFPTLPKARWGRVAEFFERAQVTAQERNLPVWSGEIYLELHRGTLTTQSGVKRLHRQAERALITAELVAGLAHLLGAAAPESLEKLWRVVLKNEFHDILPGSSVREVYEDAEGELAVVATEGVARQARALTALAGQLPRGEPGERLLALNPSLHERRLEGTLPDGSVIGTEQVLPPLSVTVLDPGALAPAPGLRVSAKGLENAHLAVRIGPDGSIAGLRHKASGREALAGPGNQIWAYPVDKPRNWDAWDIEPDYAERGERLGAETVEVMETGAHRVGLRVVYRYRDSSVVQTYRLLADGRALEIATELDWHDRRVFLRSLTPAAVRARTATFECAFGVVSRPTHANTSWDAAMFEAAAHRFIDLSEPGFGLALLNDAKYGHSARGNTLGISLLRSPAYPDPLADEGRQAFTYGLLPHRGEWHAGGVREEAENLNQPLLFARAEGLMPGEVRPLRLDGLPVGFSALKPSETGAGLVLRVYEPRGARGQVEPVPPPGWRVEGPVNLMEEPQAGATGGIGPFEVRSWRLVRA